MTCAATFAHGSPSEVVAFACAHFADSDSNSNFDAEFAWWLQPSIDTQALSGYPDGAFVDLFFLPHLYSGAKARLASQRCAMLHFAYSQGLIRIVYDHVTGRYPSYHLENDLCVTLSSESAYNQDGLFAVYSDPPCTDESQAICETIPSGMCAFPGGSASVTNIELVRGSFNFERAEVCKALNAISSLQQGTGAGVRTSYFAGTSLTDTVSRHSGART